MRLAKTDVTSFAKLDFISSKDIDKLGVHRVPSYHAIEVNIGARPHELLKLKIKDIEFIEEDGGRYAKIVLNGKTGERVVPLIDSIPYVTQWISLHPQGSNREVILLPNLRTGNVMRVSAMFKAYKNYREYFTSLLSSDIPEDDTMRIRELLKYA
jgi:integrase